MSRNLNPWIMRISDDGLGLDPATVNADRFGLKSVGERAATIGGQLDVDSALRRGTTVQLSIMIGT